MSRERPPTRAACGCCAGVEARTPVEVRNRPGLSAVAYRIGTHGDFVASMLARVSSSDYPALATLRTRDRDDYAIALLDAFACCADVLTFYQERLANESYLRTAVERRSLVELARLINYRLRPGVAAETWLAFTLEQARGSADTLTFQQPQGIPDTLTIESGVKVQSVPGPGGKPQTFETVESLEACPQWSALKPRLTKPHPPVYGSTDCYLEGAALNLKAGDALLFVGDEVEKEGSKEHWDFRIIQTASPDAKNGRTRVTWEEGLGSVHPRVPPAKNPQVHVFRRKAAVFGHNAPMWETMPAEFRTKYPEGDKATSWPKFEVSPQPDAVDLDTLYPSVVAQSWIVLAKPSYVELYRAAEATEISRAAFAISGKVTRVALKSPENYDLFKSAVREVTVYAVNEELHVTEAPDTSHVAGNAIVVSPAVENLSEGRTLLVAGTDAITGDDATEVVTLARVDPDSGGSRLVFKQNLTHQYTRASVTVFANVARATHGETVRQILGSGDAGQEHQRFDLKHTPVTFVGADNETGAESTLEVRVNGIAWHEVDTLFGAAADAHDYTLRVGDDDAAVVQFGDGRRGARVPTGQENVRATYRKGIGAAGNLAAGQLSQLLTRPLGLKAAVNPRAAEGGVAAEAADAARRNMPLGVRTLGRVVSLRDYEDFARAYTGIAKAHAAVLNLKAGRTVFITVGGEGGTRPAADGPTLAKLVSALKNAGDPLVRFEVRAYDEAFFRLGLKIRRHPDHQRDTVSGAVEAALRTSFSFDAREFGQPVALSEIMAVVQGAPGVVAVDVDWFYRGTSATRENRLVARQPNADASGNGLPAELLTLAPGPLDLLGVMP